MFHQGLSDSISMIIAVLTSFFTSRFVIKNIVSPLFIIFSPAAGRFGPPGLEIASCTAGTLSAFYSGLTVGFFNVADRFQYEDRDIGDGGEDYQSGFHNYLLFFNITKYAFVFIMPDKTFICLSGRLPEARYDLDWC